VWLPRSHDDPYAGDAPPRFDALAGASNNIRRTDRALASLVAFNATQNVRTVRRSVGLL
jgi:hypothetical protein